MKIDAGLLASAKVYAVANGTTVSDVVRDHLARLTGWRGRGSGPMTSGETPVLQILESYSRGELARSEAIDALGLQADDVAGFAKLMNANLVRWPTPSEAVTEEGASILIEAMGTLGEDG